jgi:hypothetical protein
MARWAFTCRICKHRYTYAGAMTPVPPCPKCHPEKPKKNTLDARDDQRRKSAVEEALEQCDTIAAMCEEVPERGADFAIGVAEKAADIRLTIERMQVVTRFQQDALDNMEAGVSRWLDH